MTLPKKFALHHNKGKIVVVCGPMFAGKSEELLRQLKRLNYANVPYLIFKPFVDNRTKQIIQSRDGRNMEAIEISSSDQVFAHLNKVSAYPLVVAFDEAQFFDSKIVSVVQTLASLDINVIISGLDTDFHYQPFGSMGDLLAIADEVKKLTAICITCGSEATRTHRIQYQNTTRSEATVLIGDSNFYEARCRFCHDFKPQLDPKQKQLLQAWKEQLRTNSSSKQKQKEHVVKK